jgi:hypothetical protein
MNKQLTFDIIRQQKSNASLLVLDTVSFYDRIAAPVASLSLKRQGLPQLATNVMFHTLSNMKHSIRSGLGDSTQYYPSLSNPAQLHGIVQENGAGPMIWALVSTPILNSMHDKGFGVHLPPPETLQSKLVTAFSFVDDADFAQDIPSLVHFPAESQANFDSWLGDLQGTGRDVSGNKSVWYALIHKWADNRWQYLSEADLPGELFKTIPGQTDK